MTRSPERLPAPCSENEADQIRAALQRQAGRAPDPVPVMAALATRSPSSAAGARRPRYALVATAAAATVAVVGGGTALTFAGSDGAQPAGVTMPAAATAPPPTVAGGPAASTAPSGAPDPAAPARSQVPLRYSPTWLPAGLAEYRRAVTVQNGEPELERTWVRTPPQGWTPGNQLLTLAVRRAPSGSLPEGNEVIIDGVRGRYRSAGSGDKATVEWQARPGVWVVLTQAGLDLDRATVLRVAQSLRPDPGTYVTPLRVTGRPAGEGRPLAGFETTARGAGTWRASVVTGSVTVTLGTQAESQAPGGGRPVDVGGRAGRYSASRVGDVLTTWLVVPLDGGQVLTLRSGPLDGPDGDRPAGTADPGPAPTRAGEERVPAAELVALAESVDLGTGPDVSWGP